MVFEIYWNNEQATRVDSRLLEDALVLQFFYTNAEYKTKGEGVIRLALTLEQQCIEGTITYENLVEKINFYYQLSGKFEDDSWEIFQGKWVEEGETFQFDAIADIIEQNSSISDNDDLCAVISESGQFNNEASNQQNEINDIEIVPEANEEIATPYRYCFNRQRAARSDARVRTIQRKIELQYGLPEGSVKICNPDRTIISPLAKVGTLRERWE